MSDNVIEWLPPDEAFNLLAHHTRVNVLKALNEAVEPLSFSELHERVGVDDPGQLNYHINKISDVFVQKSQSGYQLTKSGSKVVGALLSGAYTKSIKEDAIELDALCSSCSESLEIKFQPGGIRISCQNCSRNFTNITIPPGILEGVPTKDAPEVIDQWLKRFLLTLQYGFCGNCNSRSSRSLRLSDADDSPVWMTEVGVEVVISYQCPRCGGSWHIALESAILMHPPVINFHHRHGINLHETPVWTLDWLRKGATTVVSQNPLRVEVEITAADSTLLLRYDEELNVVEERTA